MSNPQTPHMISPLRSGVATIAADSDLTLISADEDFRKLVAGERGDSGAREAGPHAEPQANSLREVAGPEVAGTLQALLGAGTPDHLSCEAWVTRPDGTPSLLHVTSMRLEGEVHAGRPVYRVVVSETGRPDDVPAGCGGNGAETPANGIVSENSDDVSFAYDFAADTMSYGGRYRELFDGALVIPHFRARPFSVRVPADDVGACLRSLLDGPPQAPAKGVSEWQLRIKDGSRHWFSLFCVILRDSRGNPARAVGALRNIDRQKREQRRLLDKSRTDSMTGLRNKATTEEEIRAALAEIRPGALGILMMIDLDNFKLVNDTLGHLAGDSVIIQLARELRRTFRKEDIIGRVGGDEFHVFMRNVESLETATAKAEGLCKAACAMLDGVSLRNELSLSIGIAFSTGPIPYEELFRQADVALYHAKSNGKNRYEFFDQPSPPGGRRSEKAPPEIASTAARNSIMVDVIDILFSKYDMHEGIEKVLAFIGNAFRMDRITILEKSIDLQRISVTYEWISDPGGQTKEACRDIPVESLKLPPVSGTGGIFYCSDTSTLSAEERGFLRDPGVTALLHCAIVREGNEVGYIGFMACGNKRLWTQQEVDTLILLSKLVSEHIRQKRAALLLHENFEATRGILNSLPFAIIYVIGKRDHRIAYFNDTLRRAFPRLRPGMTCHEAFWGNKAPCGFCPAQLMGDKDSANVILKDTPFGPVVDVSVSSILWERQEPSYVVFITEHMLSEEEKEQRRKRETFSRAICAAYEHVVDIDPRTGVYEILVTSRAHMEGVPQRGDYARALETFTNTYVEPPQRKRYLQLFSLEGMRAAFSGGASMVQLDYRRYDTDGIRWKNRCSYPFTLEDGSTHILTCVRDVTEQLARERRKKQDEENYLRALQSTFTEIYRIDLDTQSIASVCIDSNLRNEGGNALSENIARKAASCVHPSDRGLFVALYNYTTIWRHVERGEKLSGEYRRLSRNGEYRWVSSLIIPLAGRGRRALVLIKDISERRRLEARRNLEERRFNTALRSTYAEIYEIDLATNKPTCLYTNNSAMIPVDRDKTADIRVIADTFIHPDDRQHFLASFGGDNVRSRFAAGEEEIPEEYRRLGSDGSYYWVSASMVPLYPRQGGEGTKALLLVKDITERKRQEEKERIAEQYNRALRKIYDELYELDVANNAYRIIYHVEGKYVTPPPQGALSDGVRLVAENMIHPEDRKRFLRFFDLGSVRAHFAAGREWLIGEFRKLWKDGRYHWASLTMFPLSPGEKGGEKYLVFIMDIGAKKQAEEIAQRNVLLERRRLDDERYRTIIEQTDTLVFEWWQDGGVPYLAPEIPRRFAGTYDKRNVLAIWRQDGVIHPEDLPLLDFLIREIREDKAHAEMTVRLLRRDGRHIWCKVAITCLLNTAWRGKRLIGTLNDVDDATRSIIALRYRAEFDTLTGIHNAQTFYAVAARLIKDHPERRYSIVRMDINRFKVINDLHGIDEGDRLLRFIARLLDGKMGDSDTCGRISGDIFYMCVARPEEEVVRLLREITEELGAYPLPSRIAPSFGVCLADGGETPVTILCDWANLALRTIKGNYLKNYACYDQKLRESILAEKTIENEMHAALTGGQFVLYLQPKVHIATGRVIGAEGLVRWVHPSGNLISPEHFVPLFEKNGFVVRLDEYIWEQACLVLRAWIDAGLKPRPVSVNMSRLHFHDTRLCEKLVGLIRDYRIPARLLELELTETAFLENAKQLVDVMRELQSHGFLFSMDDFGSGYSSLNMLKSLPINIVKIDREFLNEGVSTDQGRTIIRHTIAMAGQMNMKVIAEGVENKEQADFLLEAGCSFAQGYYYSCPLPVREFEKMAFGTPVTPAPDNPAVKAAPRDKEDTHGAVQGTGG